MGSTTRLGDWYANLMFLRPQWLILVASDRTLLPVVVPARDLPNVVPRIRESVAELLQAIGIGEADILAETAEMATVQFAKTASPRVLGVMNNMAFLLRHHLAETDSLLEVSLMLAETPFSNERTMDFPRDTVRALFGLPRMTGWSTR